MWDNDSVLKLRKQTGCGLRDCRDAFMWAEGNWDYAIEILKSKYQPVAQEPVLWKEAKERYERK